jgi:hypothetical protein
LLARNDDLLVCELNGCPLNAALFTQIRKYMYSQKSGPVTGIIDSALLIRFGKQKKKYGSFTS